MDQIALYHRNSFKCSKITTQNYSTSFSLGILSLNKKFRDPIYGIYGFVRFADEIVDTFHEHNKLELIERFEHDTYAAIKERISLNPILNSFQKVVNEYGIDYELIDRFLKSMKMDLNKKDYEQLSYEDYILGSAEVVGLMCLRVFTEGDNTYYQALKPQAMRLGAAFQKINFLRDLKADYFALGRAYFPGFELDKFNEQKKKQIELDIEQDFKAGLEGIKQLPRGARFGVYVAYVYYYSLFTKIQSLSASTILSERIRIPDFRKYALIISCYFRHTLNLI
ncbi:MAG: phytoene/squalene synthase family protein [Bacteroidota bacterium]|jgi:phytoene synthase